MYINADIVFHYGFIFFDLTSFPYFHFDDSQISVYTTSLLFMQTVKNNFLGLDTSIIILGSLEYSDAKVSEAVHHRVDLEPLHLILHEVAIIVRKPIIKLKNYMLDNYPTVHKNLIYKGIPISSRSITLLERMDHPIKFVEEDVLLVNFIQLSRIFSIQLSEKHI